ncbi:PIN domain-containing protein [candidate division KSB1 bacterium]|nr:PIN domain-containing protein [candidate division KSB1 bacterium]
MKVVLDSNIIFAALISGNEKYIEIFRLIEIFVPDYIFSEISKYGERIIKKAKIQEDFSKFIHYLFSEITVIPKLTISQENFRKAMELTQDIDEKDAPYVALSLELDIPLWTNDIKLAKGLSQKGYTSIVTNQSIFNLLEM